jgi:hypothetical protein
VNPIDAWVQVIQGAITNTGTLVNQVVASPAPVAGQVITNQLANLTLLGDTAKTTIQSLVTAAQGLPAVLQTAAQQLAANEIVAALNTLILYGFQSAIGLIGVVTAVTQTTQNTVQNLANAIGIVPEVVLAMGLGTIAPVVGTLTAGAQTVQDVLDAFGAGDPAAALGAIINSPAALTGAFLNGNPAAFLPAGLLSPWTGGAFDSGPIAIALALRDEIAATLFPVGHQPVQQAAAAKSAAVQRSAAVEDDTAAVAKAPQAAGPKVKAGASGRLATHSSRSAATDAQAASAGDTAKDTTDATNKAGQQRTGKSGNRHEKASAGADK